MEPHPQKFWIPDSDYWILFSVPGARFYLRPANDATILLLPSALEVQPPASENGVEVCVARPFA